ncbi:MAG: ribonuclease HI [Candidatus Taylorbacteria bacterium]|nr:ribonuclease HI [Candidatus Taylorbacteria bacterium]
MIPNSITIFTDGSSRGNPGPGGFGAVVVYNDEAKVESGKWKVKELGGREAYTTNNRMELTAALEALKFIQNQGSTFFPIQGRTLVLYSDSSYVVNGITKWVFGWQKNGWKTKEKRDVENRDLWEQLVETSRDKRIEWKQVSGHVGVVGNERCDEIAQTYAELTQTDAEKTLTLYNGPFSNYPIKNILDIRQDTSLAKEKSSSRAHSKAKAYSYVSLVDGKIEIHKTWGECEGRVKGKKARFKKVFNAEEEASLVEEWS